MLFSKLKTTIELFMIASRLAYYHRKEPLADRNYAMYNKDRTHLFMWTGDQLLCKKDSDVGIAEAMPHFTKNIKFVLTVKKDYVTIAE